MSECEYYRELISCMIDGELSSSEEAALALHLQSCPDCAAMHRAFNALSSSIAEDIEDAPESLHFNVMAEIRRADIKKKNSRKKRVLAIFASAACAVLVIATAYKSGTASDNFGINTVAVYDIKMERKSAAFSEPADTPLHSAVTAETADGAANSVAAAPQAAAPEEAAEIEIAADTATGFSLSRSSDDIDMGSADQAVDWQSLSAYLQGEAVLEVPELPEAPKLSLTVFEDGIYYSISFFELESGVCYVQPTDGVLMQSPCTVDQLQQFIET